MTLQGLPEEIFIIIRSKNAVLFPFQIFIKEVLNIIKKLFRNHVRLCIINNKRHINFIFKQKWTDFINCNFKPKLFWKSIKSCSQKRNRHALTAEIFCNFEGWRITISEVLNCLRLICSVPAANRVNDIFDSVFLKIKRFCWNRMPWFNHPDFLTGL